MLFRSIATGFEANSLFQHYRPKEKSKVDLFADNTIVPPKVIAERSEGEIKVLERKKKSIISDFDDESQGIIDFGNLSHENENHSRGRKQSTGEEDDENNETTLKKVKHIQNILRKEGLSNKTIKENIDTFEDVPAYIRRNMPVITSDKKSDSKLSRFTLTSDDEEGPVLRENNAYLNDNVD